MPASAALRRTAKIPRATSEQSSRDLLLAAASELMNHRNTIDISLSELATRSKLNSALVKYYFGNKEGLMLALMKRDAAIAIRDLEHLLATPLPPAIKLQRHIAGVIKT